MQKLIGLFSLLTLILTACSASSTVTSPSLTHSGINNADTRTNENIRTVRHRHRNASCPHQSTIDTR